MFKNKNGQVRSGWKILLMMLVTFALMYGFFFIFDFFVSKFVSQTVDGSYEMKVQKINEIYSSLFLPLCIIQEVVLIAVPIFIWKVFIKEPLSTMGLDFHKEKLKELGTGLLFGMGSITFVFLVLTLTGNAQVKSWVPSFSMDILTYLFLYIMVGIAEEIFVRGYIMSVLRQTKSVPLIMIVSAIIFSLMHILNASFSILPFINIALVGLLFAYMYLKSGNIWMTIGYHITWNYFQGNIFGFLVSGTENKGIITTEFPVNNLINGGGFGPEGGLVVTAAIVMGFFFLKYYYRNKEIDFIDIQWRVEG